MKQDGSYDSIFARQFGTNNAPFQIVVGSTSSDIPYIQKIGSMMTDTMTSTVEFIVLPAEHVVQPGETLGGLAIKYYGEFNKYLCIQQRNRISDPRTMQVNTVLIIPETC